MCGAKWMASSRKLPQSCSLLNYLSAVNVERKDVFNFYSLEN